MDHELKELLQSVLQESLTPVHEELKKLNQRVTNIESTMATKSDVDSLSTRVESLSSDVNSLFTRVDSLSSDVNSLSTRVDSLSSDVNSLSTRVDSLSSDVNSLSTRVDSLSSRVESLSYEVARLRDSVDSHHIENIKSDNLLMKSLDELKESIRFVNRRVADVELNVVSLRSANQ